VVSSTPWPYFTPGKDPVPIVQEAGWAPGIKRIWNQKCTIISVIIGATGIVTRSLRTNLEVVSGKHSIDSLQKAAILGT
jgi:hypothetical protein